jgi:hypothetical protein
VLHLRCVFKVASPTAEVVSCRARKELARLFSKVVQRRRASGEKGNDVLQTFIDSRFAAKSCLPSFGSLRLVRKTSQWLRFPLHWRLAVS